VTTIETIEAASQHRSAKWRICGGFQPQSGSRRWSVLVPCFARWNALLGARERVLCRHLKNISSSQIERKSIPTIRAASAPIQNAGSDCCLRKRSYMTQKGNAGKKRREYKDKFTCNERSYPRSFQRLRRSRDVFLLAFVPDDTNTMVINYVMGIIFKIHT